MSDGMTDVQRDQDRAEAYGKYIEAIAHFLIHPDSADLGRSVEDAAAASDAIRRGYYGSPTHLQNTVKSVLRDVANLKTALHEIGYEVVASK